MHEDGGYIFVFNEASRSDILRDHAKQGHSFTSVLNAPESKLRQTDLALLSFRDDKIGFVALVQLNGMTATAQVRVKFSRFLPLAAVPIVSSFR
jgi:hypothetical protein